MYLCTRARESGRGTESERACAEEAREWQQRAARRGRQAVNALLAILEHLRKTKPLRGELLHVANRLVHRVPAPLDGEKEAIGYVEAAALEVQVQRCEGLHSDEVVEHVHFRAVVCVE